MPSPTAVNLHLDKIVQAVALAVVFGLTIQSIRGEAGDENEHQRAGIMSGNSPYPRPYYAGFSQEQDEKLAKQLFYGITVRNEKTGRMRHKYLSNNSPREREGFEALQRLLLFSCQDLAPSISIALLSTLDPDGSVWGRLEFKRRKKGRRDVVADFQIEFEFERLIHVGWKREAAVRQVREKFGLSRKAVFDARRRAKLRDFRDKPLPALPEFAFLRPRDV